jgi:hypothetical protein
MWNISLCLTLFSLANFLKAVLAKFMSSQFYKCAAAAAAAAATAAAYRCLAEPAAKCLFAKLRSALCVCAT